MLCPLPLFSSSNFFCGTAPSSLHHHRLLHFESWVAWMGGPHGLLIPWHNGESVGNALSKVSSLCLRWTLVWDSQFMISWFTLEHLKQTWSKGKILPKDRFKLLAIFYLEIPTPNHCAIRLHGMALASCTVNPFCALCRRCQHTVGNPGREVWKGGKMRNWELWNFRPNNDGQMRRGDKFRHLIVQWMPPDWQQKSRRDFWPLCNQYKDNAGMGHHLTC